MIIILDEANFSANNIGKITLPFENKLATQLMSNLTSGVVSEERGWAFAKFISKLESANIVDAISYIGVPSLAKNIKEAYRNLLTGADALGIDEVNRYHLGKYGTYVDMDNSKVNKALMSYIDTSSGSVTMATGTIQKDTYSKYMLGIGYFFHCSYLTANTPAINVPYPLSLKIGINSIITGTTSFTLDSPEQFICVVNNERKLPTFPSSAVTGSVICFKNTQARLVLSAYNETLANNSVHNNGMETINIAFKRCLTESESMALNTAMTEFQESFYEDDIKELVFEK